MGPSPLCYIDNRDSGNYLRRMRSILLIERAGTRFFIHRFIHSFHSFLTESVIWFGKTANCCKQSDRYAILTLRQHYTPMKGMSEMKFVIVGKNIEVTPGLRAAVEDKIGKLEKFFTEETEVHVTLSVEKDRQKIEVTIPVKGNIIRSEQVSSDMYVSIDLVEEIIERQLKKYKNKLVDKKQGTDYFRPEFIEKDFMDEEEVKIIRTKKFDIKPMYPEDACVQMELLGHNFFVFYNAETDQVNVVYKRKGNTYGLIEPEN